MTERTRAERFLQRLERHVPIHPDLRAAYRREVDDLLFLHDTQIDKWKRRALRWRSKWWARHPKEGRRRVWGDE